ncbi:MAG: ethylbenzene dehydrogenase [Gammaproteobacteria bacterium]|nr:ethylbenzene dehydrogenase [Gammaproteobacteria bacterium]
MLIKNKMSLALQTAFLGCALSVGAVAAADLIAVNGAAAPKLDGVADDAVWKQAEAVDLRFVDGANLGGKGETTGSLKAAKVGDTLYMLLQYQDADASYRRSPYVKQADGSWKKLKDPDDKGGDNNKYYEDKVAMIWTINNTIDGFAKDGCFAVCHDEEPPKPYGNKYTEKEGQIGDMWHFKSVRTAPLGQADDQWLDHTQYDKEKSANAGRKSDAKTGGGYKDIGLVDGKPEFMSKDGKPANQGGTYWLSKMDAVAFDDSKFKPGDEVSSILISPFEGDRADISVSQVWKEGVWTLEISRKLVTGSATDVQFDNMSGEYLFGVSVFDNAAVRHAYIKKPITLKFAQ